MEVLGQATVTAEIQNVRKEMTMVVVDGEGPNLLGQGWLKDFRMLPVQPYSVSYTMATQA